MKATWYFIFVFSAFASLTQLDFAFAHGENVLGPNGGHIRMPGAFHTELVQTSDQGFKVFLLDVDWKNPVTSNSAVEARLRIKRSEQSIPCEYCVTSSA